jgi:beta-glucosidase
VPFSEADLPPFEIESTAFTYDAWHGYWHLARNGTAPAYPFGFGLSYTSFALETAEVEVSDGTVQVRATVRNTGSRPGTDVLQVYGRRLGASRPERLIGFRRVEIGPGERAAVDLELPAAALAERDTDRHAMVVRSGTYAVRVARHAVDPGITTDVELAPPS